MRFACIRHCASSATCRCTVFRGVGCCVRNTWLFRELALRLWRHHHRWWPRPLDADSQDKRSLGVLLAP
ncbi:hypothetical protein V5799_027523 [Amblyomma americanum]|uniref:Uncharacterized protein n=1 Tax=Amblyomma americanum TaxID=6943 RepID=A0AAQ4DFH1_AMBAM